MAASIALVAESEMNRKGLFLYGGGVHLQTSNFIYMGMETSRIDDQESLEQKPVNSIEQQESDPMIGLENASAELGKNFEKIDGLLESQGDIESLGGEDREKFSEFIGNLSAKAEKFKNMLSEMGKRSRRSVLYSCNCWRPCVCWGFCTDST